MDGLILIFQLFVLLNPLYSIPLLMAAQKRKMNVKIVAFKSVIAAFVIALVILFAGPLLFQAFGITLYSFRIAGGIVLLLLGISMIRPEEENYQAVKAGGLITIIATPLLTGPATISFITIKAFELGTFPVLASLVGAFLLVGTVFILAAVFIKKINFTAIDIVSRVLGLFLSAVGIEMISKGIQGLGLF